MAIKQDPEKELDHRLALALEKYKGNPELLITALQEAQDIFGYLPRKVMIHVANALTVPLAEVYSVVSFYSLFSTVPTGRHRIEVCLGTACYVRGAEKLLRELQARCGTGPGKSSPDELFSIATTRCVGACSAAPVIKTGDELHGEMNSERLAQLLEELQKR
ncbi:MAG: NAD(P)H-dependent oxidoreductase subunit E [Dethiobacteria bacterium]|nr:NAD(P)H-dependent oxidoreductase subunit E [Bacillota bacterium]HOB29363.1 NAD(P)H-dependent oxidoreductase subunit E [Bacillota bacterium]HPZ41177.1 NAD(P)H-dependent oxidoreductase subunit E [Bacillota bacterium]